jgi:hypothetical protein
MLLLRSVVVVMVVGAAAAAAADAHRADARRLGLVGAVIKAGNAASAPEAAAFSGTSARGGMFLKGGKNTVSVT